MKHSGLNRLPIDHLRGMYIEFTSRPGVLRGLQPLDDVSRAQGVHFNCPKCMSDSSKAHGVTLLFKLKNVPDEAAPPGRYAPKVFPSKVRELTLGPVKSPYCEWEGWVYNGEVVWK